MTWKEFFGFVWNKKATENGGAVDMYLDVETSYFRLCCFERGVPIFRVTIAAGIVMHLFALGFEWGDVQVDHNWILLGQNQVSFAVLFYLLLTLMNSFTYQQQPGVDPHFFIQLQAMLHVALLPGTIISGIAYWRLLHGSWYDSGVQASKATAIVVMVFMGCFGLYDAQWKHLLFSTAVLFAHIAYVLVLSMFGNFIYAPVLQLNFVDLMFWGVEFMVYNILFHGIYIYIQQWKEKRRQNGTLWLPQKTKTNNNNNNNTV